MKPSNQYIINNSYTSTGSCAADSDCDTTGEACKADNTCGTYTHDLIFDLC